MTNNCDCTGNFNLSTGDCADREADYIAGLMAETLQIGGGPVNVFPLLGVHNQGSTTDLVGQGYPLSSGTPSGYNVLDAFTVNASVWRSIQVGQDVLSDAFIGYDFGTKKAWTATPSPTERYQKPEPIRKRVSTIRLKQGPNQINRAPLLQVSASDDGVRWQIIDTVVAGDTDELVELKVQSPAAYNKWRLTPAFFNGVAANQPWEVELIQLLESTQVALDNIEDYVLLENRDRSYCRSSVLLKCNYDLLDVQTELARFGISLPQTYIFTCSFNTMVSTLGRPIVVGDVVELPGETQYDAMLRPVKKWLEVTDCGWSTEGYTHNWKPNLYRFYAQPILPSIEHRDLLGLPGVVNQQQSADSVVLGGLLQNQQALDATQALTQEYDDLTPQTGSDPQDIRSAKPIIGKRGEYDGTDLYAQDAIPPDGAPYTVGDVLPRANEVVDGHYHRQTYTGVSASIRPPDRLLRWSASSGRWSVVEVNTRRKPTATKPTAEKFIQSSSKRNLDD